MYLQCIPVNKTSTVSLCSSDSLKKKLSALPSPEREVSTVNLKKDVKYGLGKGVYMHSAATSHLTVLSSIIDGMSVCVCWHLFVCVCSPGFQVVGGENSGRMDLGTIVSSITPGGPADVNGCLKPGMPGFCHTLFCVGSVCVFFYAYLALGRHRCKLQLGWCAEALVLLCVGGELSSLLPHLVVPSLCNSP